MKRDDAVKHLQSLPTHTNVVVLPLEYYRRVSGGDRIGASAEALMLRLLCGEDYKSHPRDFTDFVRCLRLMADFPELRARLGEMGEVSPEWAAWVNNWDELERSVGRRSDVPITDPDLFIYQMLQKARTNKA
jgi:hypothetical protein